LRNHTDSATGFNTDDEECVGVADCKSIRAFSGVAQGKKRLLQSLTDCAIRPFQNENLVLVKEISAQTVEQMQEVA